MDATSYNVSILRLLDDTANIAKRACNSTNLSPNGQHSLDNPPGKATAKSNIHRQGVVVSSERVKGIRSRLGDDYELQPDFIYHDDKYHGPEPLLQHIILLRREIRQLTKRLQRLESAGEIIGPIPKTPRQQCNSDSTLKVLFRLTNRQREVFLLLADGKTMKEVAFLLNITAKTTEFHWDRIKQRLNITNYVDASKLAYSTGLLSHNNRNGEHVV